MITVDDKETQLDDLLERMAEEVQLDATRYERMKSSYEAVKSWIEEDEKFFKPYKYDVYPHGSVRILTTVKPIGRDEFDLDIVIHLKSSWSQHTPQRIYKELKRRLEEHEKYKSMLEAKNRCLRLNYSGDFHMDILPGIQENEFDNNKIKVPDRELGGWVSSNPRGYADWFIARAKQSKVPLIKKVMNQAETIPADDFNSKRPLQRAVQLIKRYRDIFFEKDDTYKTGSIILTTIAGQFYEGEESVFETVDNIITKILSKVNQPLSRFKVLNPVNAAEDFTDKWETEPKYYEAFKKFVNHLHGEWQKLKQDHGIPEEGNILKGLFGNDVFNKAQTGQTAVLEGLRKSNSLGAIRRNGVLSAASAVGTATIKANTFFGE